MTQDAQGTSLADPPSSSRTEAPPSSPRLTANVYEPAGGEAYVLEVPVPGLTPDEIIIEADVDTITVRTEPRQSASEPGRTYLQREETMEPQSRVFEFPMELDTDNVRATLENGLLRIRALKAAAGQRRVIRVGGQ